MSSQPVPSPTEQEIQLLITSMAQLRICNYATVSALVFMLYDIMINLNKEIPLVWRYRQTNDLASSFNDFRRVMQVLVHLLFIFSRYYGLVFLSIMFAVNNVTGLSVTFCKVYYYYLILAGTVLYVTSVNVILAIRINALYGGKQGCRLLLGSLVVGEFLVEFSVCIVVAMRSTAAVVSPPPWISWPGCTLSSRVTPALTLASWITALLVSTFFCAMTLKGILFDNHEEVSVAQNIFRLPPRTKVLLCDCVTFYFLTFAVVLASTVVLTVVQNELSVLPVLLLITIYSYCASRLILNIRAIDNKLCPRDVPDDPDSLPTTQFLTLSEPNERPVASSSRV